MSYRLGLAVLFLFQTASFAKGNIGPKTWEFVGCVPTPTECYYSCNSHKIIIEKDGDRCPYPTEGAFACYCAFYGEQH